MKGNDFSEYVGKPLYYVTYKFVDGELKLKISEARLESIEDSVYNVLLGDAGNMIIPFGIFEMGRDFWSSPKEAVEMWIKEHETTAAKLLRDSKINTDYANAGKKFLEELNKEK